VRTRFAALVAVGALFLAACSSGVGQTPSAPQFSITPSLGAPASAAPANLTIYGAASLTSVLARVRTVYEAAKPGTNLTISTDSSTALETKIEQGAPADLLLSADTANPQRLIDKGFAAGRLTKFASNLLTVIVPVGNPARIQTPADLARSGVKVIAAGETLPITKYANQFVVNLARQPGYPTDFVAKYTANIVSKQDNVSAVVAQIAFGEGDAGIVYVTDAKTSTRVLTIAVPAAANVPATYSGVVVKASANAAAAQAFLTWIAGPDGQAILGSFGFLPAS
jgi:molybdate transport system substrate-binding protein